MTQHWIPDLTRALKILDSFESNRRQAAKEREAGADMANPESWGARCARDAKRDKAEARRFVLDSWHDWESDQGAAVYWLSLFGWPRATWHAIQKEGAKLEAKAKAEAERKAKARALADAKLFGDCSADVFGQYLPPDGYESGSLADGNGQFAQTEFAKRLARAHKASKAAGYTNRTKRLWLRVKEAREHAAGFPARDRARMIARLRDGFERWQRGEGSKPSAWQYTARELATERAILEAADVAEREAVALAAYESWRQTPTAVKRPDSRLFAEGSTPRLVLEGFEREEAERIAAELERWRETRGSRNPAPKPNCGGHTWPIDFDGRFPDLAARLGGDPWRELVFGTTKAEEEARAAFNAEQERLRHAAEAEQLEAWRAGNWQGRVSDGLGGAALRIVGDILETSHGARVPLADAIKAFRFVKLLRIKAEREGLEPGAVVWKANGNRVFVGDYALTRIMADGSFVAGCHNINWPEIERAAVTAGVLEAEPSDAAEVTSKGVH